jgi:hypothetical protein
LLQTGAVLFQERYTLSRLIEAQSGEYEMWEGLDMFGGPVLIKAWPFGTNEPSDEERALWNAELRHLFRLASLPESEEHLVVLRDAGIDWANKCFAMVLLAPGLSSLEKLLSSRARHGWLTNLKTHAVRSELWRGVRRIALGIIQLHEQQMFHRAVLPKSVWVDPDRGPSTFRLGGFEWTVRLGEQSRIGGAAVANSTGTYSFESDWFLFGLLIARLVAAVGPDLELEKVNDFLAEQNYLTGNERALLEGLLANDPHARLSQGREIVRRIEQIVKALDEPRRITSEDYLALVVMLGPLRPLTLAVTQAEESISALDTESQRQFIERDLQQPRVIRREGTDRESYILVGNRLRYFVTEYLRDEASERGAWDLAYCGNPTELRYSAGGNDQTELRRLPVRVFTLRALAMDENVARKSAVAWKPYLPREISNTAAQDDLQRIHDFFRVTNQIELLMRDAEIFSYVIRELRSVDGAEEVLLYEVPRERTTPDFAKLVDTLGEFILQEQDKRDGDLIYLGEEDALDLRREVPRTEFWNVIDADSEAGEVRLRRPKRPGQGPPPMRGYLRAYGLFGQMALIKRRKRAIDRLKGHAYLLRALKSPDFTFLDTGESLPLKIDSTKIDEAKRSAMASIWRTRPIFALQGPPGTGKTTLVANLLAQVFTDDPVAQVLVTAQAHAAVDVLREKVRAEVAGMQTPPLAVRLQRTKGDTTQDPDYVQQVALRLLSGAVSELGKEEDRKPIQSQWLEKANEVIRALARGDTDGHPADICELVKRAAGITYCTTTAANLAALADSTQTFDWSIVEEAGKAHGFDLALPLQTGHRWLLIGDQKQLSPYRFENFRKGLSQLNETFDTIQSLPERAGGQVDLDLLLRWNKYDESERTSRKELWLHWLPFFETVYLTCSRVKLASGGTEIGAPGGPVLAKMLSRQHRMHPTIAGLVSAAYYGDGLQSETYAPNGELIKRFVHPFVVPSELAGCAILWLDVPWVGANGNDSASLEGFEGRYTSEDESKAIASLLKTLLIPGDDRLDLAILSPYRRQVQKLNRHFETISLPNWVKPREGGELRDLKGPAATVDSFQGNQADVVIVSLVRNNMDAPGRGLGFLRESRRMNVLFSRAERLLVLVGSWDFFERQLADIPADDTQPLGHWRLAMNYLNSCLISGRAIRLPVHSLKETL